MGKGSGGSLTYSGSQVRALRDYGRSNGVRVTASPRGDGTYIFRVSGAGRRFSTDSARAVRETIRELRG